MNKEQMGILKQNKVILENFDIDTTTSKNLNLNSGIYLTAEKLLQCRILAKNRREK